MAVKCIGAAGEAMLSCRDGRILRRGKATDGLRAVSRLFAVRHVCAGLLGQHAEGVVVPFDDRSWMPYD